MKHPVRRGPYEHYPEWLSRERLLKLKVAIHGDESIEMPSGAAEQLAVLHAFPAEPYHRLHVVPREFGGKVLREVLVKQDAHGSTARRARF